MKAKMTYGELRNILNKFNYHELECTVTVMNMNKEYMGVSSLCFEKENEVLDKGNPFLKV